MFNDLDCAFDSDNELHCERIVEWDELHVHGAGFQRGRGGFII